MSLYSNKLLQYFVIPIVFMSLISSMATAYPHAPSVVGYSPDDLSSISGITVLFESWIKKHGKKYTSTKEKSNRFENFKKNLKYIDDRNKVVSSYCLGLNEFADISNDERKKMKSGKLKVDQLTKRYMVPAQEFKPTGLETLPDSVDWRNGRAVTSVKYEGRCGFLGIFGCGGCNQIVTGKLVTLSVQQLIDCSPQPNPCTTHTNSFNVTFNYIKNDGLSREHDYPYKDIRTKCKKRKPSNPVTISGYIRVPAQQDENNFLSALAQQPLVVGVNGYACHDFLFYKRGILHVNAKDCSTDHDHYITAVGYGTAPKHKLDYFITKNSWGTKWGQEGYIRMKRHTGNPSGQCGINADVSYPVKNN